MSSKFSSVIGLLSTIVTTTVCINIHCNKSKYIEYDKVNIESCNRLIKAKLSEKRYIHCQNVSKEAIKLAEKYGADVKKAEIAGLLHDITKEFNVAQHLKIFKMYNIKLKDIERLSFKLWHAISGSQYIRNVLKVCDKDILNAVRYHTTARKGMSTLEKIIFIADFISEDRDFEGVEKLRELAYIDLNKTVLEGLKFTIDVLILKNQQIHEDTIFAYNELVKNRKGE